MRRLFITLVLALCFVSFISAQDYNTGVGLRGGFESGLTIKHFVNRNSALEGLLTIRWQGFDVTGLYEIHYQAFEVDHLNWYFGGGAHLGGYNGNDLATWGTYSALIGIDGILGIEYNFREAPINIGIDWNPRIDIYGMTRFRAEGFALVIRYIF